MLPRNSWVVETFGPTCGETGSLFSAIPFVHKKIQEIKHPNFWKLSVKF